MIAPDVLRFVRAALPPAPARVLEIGAGDGELARALRGDGYDVVAIDPASESPDVLAVALNELDERPASFDAGVAVVTHPSGRSLDMTDRERVGVQHPDPYRGNVIRRRNEALFDCERADPGQQVAAVLVVRYLGPVGPNLKK